MKNYEIYEKDGVLKLTNGIGSIEITKELISDLIIALNNFDEREGE